MLERPPRTYWNLLMLFCMAGVQWDEACALAREFAEKPTAASKQEKAA